MPGPQIIRNKILTMPELSAWLKRWHITGKKIVFTNGCFDLLHPGHADYLSQASALGDVLIVGINTDRSVTGLKGSSRPINTQEARAFMVASFGFVDAVILFDEETPEKLIAAILPDILVKGADYEISQIAGSDIVLEKGGKVIRIPLLEGYSSTAIENKILELAGKK